MTKIHGDAHALMVALEREYGIPEAHAERVCENVNAYGESAEPVDGRGYVLVTRKGRIYVIEEHFKP
jgi:hypothetical protein